VKNLNVIIVLSTAAIRRTCLTDQGVGCKLSDGDSKMSKHVGV